MEWIQTYEEGLIVCPASERAEHSEASILAHSEASSPAFLCYLREKKGTSCKGRKGFHLKDRKLTL